MSAPDFGKPFKDLSADEIRQLEEHDWTPGQIMRAMVVALQMGEMEAVADLLQRLALKDDPAAANIILETVKYQAGTVSR